jgi:hypothetical protein
MVVVLTFKIEAALERLLEDQRRSEANGSGNSEH